MKTVICIIMLLGVFFIGSQSATAVTYKFGMLPLIGWAEFRVAEVKGFWEKQGVTLEFIEYSNPLDYVRAISQKRIDIGALPMAVVTGPRNSGNPDLMYLGTLSIADHHKYVIIKNDLIGKSLKGRTIGIFNPDIANNFLLSTYLKTVQTDLADVRLVPMNTDELEENFIKGRLQAVLALDRGNRFYEQADGIIAISTRNFYEPHGLTIGKSLLDTIPPEDLKKILRGCIEAIEWIRDPANWEEYMTILKEYFLANLPDLSESQIRILTKEGKFFDPQILLEHNQQHLREYFTEFHAFLSSQGAIQEDVLNAFTYDNVIYNQVLIEVLQEYAR